MKQVAGTMKLELAQYREVAAFAQFGSDLDEATQALLNRGARLTEVLKQAQYSPLAMEAMVVLLFGATRGYLDGLPVNKVGAFEAAVHGHAGLDAVRATIKAEGVVSDATEAKMRGLLDEVVASVKAAAA